MLVSFVFIVEAMDAPSLCARHSVSDLLPLLRALRGSSAQAMNKGPVVSKRVWQVTGTGNR